MGGTLNGPREGALQRVKGWLPVLRVVASVVMLEDRWHIKAPNLAAEALYDYFDHKAAQEKAQVRAQPAPVAAAAKNGG